jgi:hypothetical protein
MKSFKINKQYDRIKIIIKLMINKTVNNKLYAIRKITKYTNKIILKLINNLIRTINIKLMKINLQI